MSMETAARDQLRGVLADTEPVVAAKLREALMQGWISGWVYWHPATQVGCVLGVVAAAEGAEDPALRAMEFNAGAMCRLEEWAEPICVGEVPDAGAYRDSGPFRAAMLVRWIDEFEAERVSA